MGAAGGSRQMNINLAILWETVVEARLDTNAHQSEGVERDFIGVHSCVFVVDGFVLLYPSGRRESPGLLLKGGARLCRALISPQMAHNELQVVECAEHRQFAGSSTATRIRLSRHSQGSTESRPTRCTQRYQ